MILGEALGVDITGSATLRHLMHHRLPGQKMIRTDKSDHTRRVAICAQFAMPLEADLIVL